MISVIRNNTIKGQNILYLFYHKKGDAVLLESIKSMSIKQILNIYHIGKLFNVEKIMLV